MLAWVEDWPMKWPRKQRKLFVLLFPITVPLWLLGWVLFIIAVLAALLLCVLFNAIAWFPALLYCTYKGLEKPWWRSMVDVMMHDLFPGTNE